MPIGTAAAIMGGGALLGAIAGGIAGEQDTPEQVIKTDSTTNSNQTTTSSEQSGSKSGSTAEQKTTFDPASQEERALQAASLAQYLQGLQQMGQYEQGITGAQGLQDQARAGIQDIYSGKALQMTPQEMANIQAIRGQMIEQGQSDVNKMLEQGSLRANQSAAARGLRGQAAMQLQGDVLRAGADQFGDITRQANMYAAQQAVQLPYQRVNAQSPFLQQGMGLADMMRLQAAQNRMAAQSPFMLSLLTDLRKAGGTTRANNAGWNSGWSTGTQSTSGTSRTFGQQINPGQEGPGWVAGAAGGVLGSLGPIGNVAGGLGQAYGSGLIKKG